MLVVMNIFRQKMKRCRCVYSIPGQQYDQTFIFLKISELNFNMQIASPYGRSKFQWISISYDQIVMLW